MSLAAGPAGVAHWAAAAWVLGVVVRQWQATAAPAHGTGDEPVVLNVNVPNLSRSSLKGVLVTHPARVSCLTRYRFSPDPHVKHALSVIARDEPDPAVEPWTDSWAVALGYVAITPFGAFPDLLRVVPWAAPSEAVELPMAA
jgi:broad specificity polyphosphatase/5'/3'-nucleotidase SurE